LRFYHANLIALESVLGKIMTNDSLISISINLTLIRTTCQSISVSGNGQNTQGADLLAPSKSHSFTYTNGLKKAAEVSPRCFTVLHPDGIPLLTNIFLKQMKYVELTCLLGSSMLSWSVVLVDLL
jgi:hypothetical protein